MALRVSKSKSKTKALEYSREVGATGESAAKTDSRELTPEASRNSTQKRDPFETLRGTVLFYKDPFEPVGVEDWEALK